MNRKPILLVALVALLALILAAVAFGSPNRKIWCAGNICVADDGGISPETLPRHGKAPVTARLNAEISTRDGSHPPPFKSMDLKIDKTVSLDAEGLPVCRAGQISASTTATVKQVCDDAIVGSGKAEVEVAFPEQAPFRSTGPLVLFNGGVKGPVTTSSSTPTSTCRRRPRSSSRRRSRRSTRAGSGCGSRRKSRRSPAARFGDDVRPPRRPPLHLRGQEEELPLGELPDR